jgi:hypothetical protein
VRANAIPRPSDAAQRRAASAIWAALRALEKMRSESMAPWKESPEGAFDPIAVIPPAVVGGVAATVPSATPLT